MPASIAEIEVQGGVRSLKCPMTGITVISEDDGFDEGRPHSPHLRFFIDWVGQVWAPSPDVMPDEHRREQQALLAILADDESHATQNEQIAACAAILPSSAFILEVLDPPQGSHDGSICYACFDFEVSQNGTALMQVA